MWLEMKGGTNSSERPVQKKQGEPQVETVRTNKPGRQAASSDWQQLGVADAASLGVADAKPGCSLRQGLKSNGGVIYE